MRLGNFEYYIKSKKSYFFCYYTRFEFLVRLFNRFQLLWPVPLVFHLSKFLPLIFLEIWMCAYYFLKITIRSLIFLNFCVSFVNFCDMHEVMWCSFIYTHKHLFFWKLLVFWKIWNILSFWQFWFKLLKFCMVFKTLDLKMLKYFESVIFVYQTFWNSYFICPFNGFSVNYTYFN
jgi:hypothetical protein